MNHRAFMEMAIRLAERGRGQVWPGPLEGCVITDDYGLPDQSHGARAMRLIRQFLLPEGGRITAR